MSHRSFIVAAVVLCWAGAAVAQVEEEEAAPPKPLKKIDVPDDPIRVAPNTPNVLPDLSRAAEAALDHPTLKAFFVRSAVPYDRLTTVGGRPQRVAPVPLHFGKDKFPDEFAVQPLDERNQPGEAITFAAGQVRSIAPYEQLALNEVEALLKLPANATAPPVKDRLLAAERLLGQVLFFHEAARLETDYARPKRLGTNWDRLKSALDDKLLEVRLSLGKETAAAKEWKALQEMVLKYSERYRTRPDVLREFAAFRLAEAEDLVKLDAAPDVERALAMLRDYEARYPESTPDAAKRLRAAFGAKAKLFLDAAQKLAAGNQAEARNILRTVETLDPEQPGLQELRNQLRSGAGTLVVGTRRLPELMSPALARFDSERQVVELIFEGLLARVPDEKLGTAYRPALALHVPRAVPGGREFEVVAKAEWSNPERDRFELGDVASTIHLHRGQRTVAASSADDLEVAGVVGSSIRVGFKQPHPDPRELLAFKVLPGRWMQAHKISFDDEAFARSPFGTGPFRLPVNHRPAVSGTPVKDVRLVADPGFGKRFAGQPSLQGVTFLETTKLTDPLNEIRGDRLHILPDIPTADVAKYQALPNAVVATAANNRRIHMLAINHRHRALQDPEVRKGIQAAIDREAILNDVFRAGSKAYHKALTGPFPPDTWSVPKGELPALFQPSTAAAKLRAAAGTPLTLIYPDDEPLSREACERIAQQVTEAGLPLRAEGVPPRAFLQRLEREHRYELAYVAYDYANDWYPHELARLLDGSAADHGGRNFLGYSAPGTNSTLGPDRKFTSLLAAVRTLRDFETGLKPKAQEIHAKFADVVPFVPLWQLDRHTVVSKSLKLPFPPESLNPTTLFDGVRDWKLDGP